MAKALVFPGQGAQKVGMGADFLSSELCNIARDILGFDLAQIMESGPEEKLQQTSSCQPALFLHSALAFEEMKKRELHMDAEYFLGLSLGEFSALYAAGALSFEQTMKALSVRGSAMQNACESSGGSMTSVIGLEDTDVEQVCDAARGEDVLVAANYNSPGQLVLSGSKVALERAEPMLTEKGARRVMPLSVAGAFHSPLMSPAQVPLRSFLEECSFNENVSKVISNVTAREHSLENIVDGLTAQATAPTRWKQSIEYLANEKGVDTFIEVGTGRVLSGLIKRTVTGLELKNYGALADFE